MNTPVREGETIEGSRTMRNRPYPVLKCSGGCGGGVVRLCEGGRTSSDCSKKNFVDAPSSQRPLASGFSFLSFY